MNKTNISDRDSLIQALERQAGSGVDVVKDAREVLHLYNKCGFSLDDDNILPLVGVESETDDLNLGKIDQKLSVWIYENYGPVLTAAKSYIQGLLTQ